MTAQYLWVFPFGLCKRALTASYFEHQRVLASRSTPALISVAHAKRFEPYLAIVPILQGNLEVEQTIGRVTGVRRFVKIEMCDTCVPGGAEFGFPRHLRIGATGRARRNSPQQRKLGFRKAFAHEFFPTLANRHFVKPVARWRAADRPRLVRRTRLPRSR